MHEHPRLVPDEFDVPARLEANGFHLRMLCVGDLIKDYDAVMTSVEHLQSTFSATSNRDWPAGLTLEEDLVDLGWHQREFTLRSSFAYTMMSPAESRCLGCVYVNPTSKRDHDATVSMWVRASELDSGLDQRLFDAVQSWIHEAWPFRNPVFPGRTVSVEDYRALPERADGRDR